MPDRDRGADPSASEDALADTVAPTAPAPAGDLGSDATVAAGTTPPAPGSRPPSRLSPGSLGGIASAGPARDPELPTVDAELYTTGDEIARGGMGRIVGATDRRLGRPVALKELLAGGSDALLRFRREALITARLQHPAIVPVYEAGQWPSGEPFFAMKLVAGRPLDQVIGAARTFDERLALLPSLIAVCEAIAYAHSQRVVHRDLKPANVLIGDFGETVVIDWGLAKDLDADDSVTSDLRTRRRAADAAAAPGPDPAMATDVGATRDHVDRDPTGSTLTLAGAVMGTPAYMPPEQARGDSVDERADVFSLGALLYHSLAGAPPYNARSATDVMAHAIAGKVVPLRDRAPAAPADLVAIIARAMAHEPANRYPTARELAEELRRFQTGQLVGAHQYSSWEKLVRFVRRHRAAVTIAAIALLAFSVGGTLAVRKIVAERDRAESARHLAERRRDAAEKLVDFMVSDMRARLDAVGKLALMAGLGEHVRDYYDELSELPGGIRPEDIDRMAGAMQILGSAERQSGDLDAALATFEDARARLRVLVDEDPRSPETPRRLGKIGAATVLIGQILQARGKNDDAFAAYREAAGIYEQARASAPSDRDLLLGNADAHDRIGDLLRNKGAAEDAIEHYQAARRLRQDVLDRDDRDLDAAYGLSTSDMKLGSAEQNRGATRAALDYYRASVARREALAAAEDERIDFRHGLSFVRSILGDLLRETGEIEQARAAYQAAIETLDFLVHKDADNTEWRRDRGNAYANLGFVLYDLGDARGALDRYAAALTNHAELTARDPDNTSWKMDVSRAHTRAGDAHLFLGDIDAALRSHEDALVIRRALVARDGKNAPWRRALAWSHHKIAGVLELGGDVGGALASAREALAVREALVAAAPTSAGLRNELALSELAIGRLLRRDGKPDDALRSLDRAVDRERVLVDADADNLEWKEGLAGALLIRSQTRLGTGDRTGAVGDAAEALAIADPIAARLPQSAVWQVLLAQAHWALAGAGDDPSAHTLAARTVLDALDASGRLGFEQRALGRAVRGGAP